jgi:hypothetical protein
MSGLVSIACEANAKESLRQMGFGRRGQTVTRLLDNLLVEGQQTGGRYRKSKSSRPSR